MNLLEKSDAMEKIAALKARLNELGYDCGAGEGFDPTTAWAVRWFRYRNQLGHIGYVDEQMWEKLFSDAAVRGMDGVFQYYSQEDPLWAHYPYDAIYTEDIETMATSACGPTSMAMAVSTLIGRAVLPVTLADWANANGHRDPQGEDGTDEFFFPACAKNYGIHAEVLNAAAEDYAKCEQALQQGAVVIANVVPGSPYTKGGHYNVIREIRDGLVYVEDPNPANISIPPHPLKEWIDGQFAQLLVIVRK